jgi:hypothetical protein
MGKIFNITPVDVPHVETKYRRIQSAIPHPDSIATLEKLRALEPLSMQGQPPIVWDKAEDISVYDKHGNRWLDWSSGVLVTNAGHGVKEVRDAIIAQVQSGLLHNYVFPSEERAELVELLASVSPEGLDKIFEAAGFELRQPGCSACLGMNEDKIPAGEYCVSTSNRNFEGRQGQGARTILASPLMAAAAAIEGKIVDVRNYLN